jgi:hypothetical protein
LEEIAIKPGEAWLTNSKKEDKLKKWGSIVKGARAVEAAIAEADYTKEDLVEFEERAEHWREVARKADEAARKEDEARKQWIKERKAQRKLMKEAEQAHAAHPIQR